MMADSPYKMIKLNLSVDVFISKEDEAHNSLIQVEAVATDTAVNSTVKEGHGEWQN